MIGDDYTSDDMGSAYEEGVKKLTVLELEHVTSKNKGTEGIMFTFCINGNPEHKVKKTFWESKFLNRFFTSFLTDLGLDPKELNDAAKNGRFKQWVERYVLGRSGEFHCEKGEPKADGKRFLIPWTQAELDLRDWQRSQNGEKAPSGDNKFSDRSSPDSMTPPDFPSDIPF